MMRQAFETFCSSCASCSRDSFLRVLWAKAAIRSLLSVGVSEQLPMYSGDRVVAPVVSPDRTGRLSENYRPTSAGGRRGVMTHRAPPRRAAMMAVAIPWYPLKSALAAPLMHG